MVFFKVALKRLFDNYRPQPKDEGRSCFQLVSSHTSTGGGVPHLVDGGYPHPSQLGGVPHPVLMGGGYPHLANGGYHHLTGGGTPPPIRTGWGIPPTLLGPDGGTPPPQIWSQSNSACTCYTAGDMPLAFTQEDFSCSL